MCAVNLADGVFQVPVATQSGGAGEINGRGDIGIGVVSHPGNELDGGAIFRDLAAVEQQVTIFTQGCAHLTQQTGILFNVVRVEGDGAQGELAPPTVGEDVNG